MAKQENKVKTIQLGLRVDTRLLEKIEKLAELEGIDKMSWIRRSLSLATIDVESRITDELIKEYINLRTDDNNLLKWAKFKAIPKDLREARAERIKKISK